MGLYFRKSINLGGGIKLNLSKRGVGISGGIKGARISTGPSGTYMNLSIPGTGVYYRKRLSGSNSSYRTSSSSTRYPYQRTIVNEYTGETRTVRAATQWELDEQVRNEELRMETNELRARRNAQITSQREKAEEMTRQVQEIQKSLGSIISATISVDDKLNWDEQYNKESYPEFVFSEPAPTQAKIGFLDKLFGKADDSFEKTKQSYEERKTQAFKEYLKSKQEFETEQREHNADVSFLRENFEIGEKTAIEKYASVVLANSKYPAELEMDYDIDYNVEDLTILVSFLLPRFDDFPTVERYTFNQSTNEINEISMSKLSARQIYEKTLLSVGIRTIHELFEAIYNNSVERVVFTGYVLNENSTDSVTDFINNVRAIFKITATKELFENIELSDSNVAEIIEQLDVIRISDFTNTSDEI